MYRGARGGSPQEFAGQTKFLDQRGQSFRIREALRADIEEESVLLGSIDDAAEPAAALQQEHGQATLLQAPSACQPGDSAADYDYLGGRWPREMRSS